MNYFDSEAYEIALVFKSELEKIMNEEIFRSDYIVKQMERGALYYKYTKRVLTCLADDEVAEKAAQDVVLELANFAVTLGERVASILKSAEETTAVDSPETKKDNGRKKDNYYYNEKGELVIPGGDSETARQILSALRCKKAAAAALQELESTPK